MFILTISHLHTKRGLQKVWRRTLKKRFFSLGVFLLYLEVCFVVFSATVQADLGWIQVSNPSGGTWYTADTMYISWSSSDAGNYVDIVLFIGGVQSITIASDVSNSGSYGYYYWLIPGGISAESSCRIKIISTSNESIYGYSSSFTLRERSISLSSPSAGTILYSDDAVSISWTSQNVVGFVQLSLYDDGTYIMGITQSASSQESYLWYIPTMIHSGTSYRIRIEATGYSGISAYSNYFTIRKRMIKVTAPTADTVWYLGGIYQITWESESAGTSVDISLYKKTPYQMDYYYSQSIIAGTDNDGRQTWTVPLNLPSDSSYRIYISSNTYATVHNYSEVFQVEQRYIHVSSPENNVIWYIGETYNITWTSQNAGERVTIELYQNGTKKVVLVENTTNAGVFTWIVPLGTTPDSSSQIKVSSRNITSVYGISQTFSLLRKSIEISSPEETALWYKGERYVIFWETKGFSSNVNIELYAEATTVVTIANNVANSGRYEWTVPLGASSGSLYQIKITSVSDDSIYGYSQGHFAIESTFVQQWSGTIILFSVVSVGFIVAYIVIIRKWRRRIATEKESQESGVFSNISEQLSDEEYENIWEKNRD
jgi:hypothetical protein